MGSEGASPPPNNQLTVTPCGNKQQGYILPPSLPQAVRFMPPPYKAHLPDKSIKLEWHLHS